MEANYELCEACEKAMEEAGVFGLTVEQMLEDKVEFTFDLALILFQEGHDLKRASSTKVTRLISGDFDGDKDEEYQFALISDEKAIAYLTFTADDILANDWTIVKIGSAI